ncbi:SRPBCC domain-containing protein [Mucilaginibacter corticis]|uniref:SRPBCC domain-containing protein n=1 Tax=Mucilaginibacter corticis TaxID=2597670 RepID=A0A556MMT3_9SPHI|nr:SRPBCC domain-containing protein [Mucilaginibacter corticis]TSJ41069.1 SRPBCC domain-containing protein [Mucilaginibacter corticis]
MQDYQISFTVSQTPQEVFDAVKKVADWWRPIEGSSGKAGDEFIYRHGDVHYSRHRITEMVPGQKLVWLTTDSRLNFVAQKEEWNGSKLIFDIAEKDGTTTLTFTQKGLTPALECYGACSGAWGFYVGGSLLALIESGQGRPDK